MGRKTQPQPTITIMVFQGNLKKLIFSVKAYFTWINLYFNEHTGLTVYRLLRKSAAPGFMVVGIV